MTLDNHRASVNNSDEDPFFSCLSSRHASTNAAARKPISGTESGLEQSSSGDSQVAAPMQQPQSQSHPEPAEHESSASPPKSRWVPPFIARHQHNPKHHHFCPKPMMERLTRAHPYSTKNAADRDWNENMGESSGFRTFTMTERLLSSPGLPMTTKRWSLTSLDERRSPLTHPPRPSTIQVLDTHIEDPTTASFAIENIVCNIRAYLSNRRHGNCKSRPDLAGISNENQHVPRSSSVPPIQRPDIQSQEETSDSYLVSTNDIAGILDIVIAGLRRLHDDHLPTGGCLSVLLSKEPSARPITCATAIIPLASSLADPATTISSVNPSFSELGQQGSLDPRGHISQSNTTTIISRQSVTQVNWDISPESSAIDTPWRTCNTPRPSPVVLRCISNDGTPHNSTSVGSRVVTRRASSTFISETFNPELLLSALPLLERPHSSQALKALRDENKIDMEDALDVPIMVPSNMDEETVLSHRDSCSDLYDYGVDAHFGIQSSVPISQGNIVSHVLPMNDSIPRRFRRSLESGGRPKNRMGSAIDISSHQKRSCACPSLEHSENTDLDPSGPILDKLRRFSFMPILDETPESLRRATSPSPLRTQDELRMRGEDRKRSSKEILEDILARAPPTPKPSRNITGFGSTFTIGSRRSSKRNSKPAQRACSEDYTPHLCHDDLSTPAPCLEREHWLW